jgi:hypothetical protein
MTTYLVNALEGHDSESGLGAEGLLRWRLPNSHRTTSRAISANEGDGAHDRISEV